MAKARLTRISFLKFDAAGDTACGADQDGDGVGDSKCSIRPDFSANAGNRSLGAYAQDSWQITPYFTLNAGLRWEQQVGYTAEVLQGTIAPDTGETIPKEAFKLDSMFAPRLGFIFDPTKEGKAKIMGHWGRFYETVPLDINVRAFGGEITNERLVGTDGNGDPDGSCAFTHGDADLANSILGCTAADGQTSQLGGAISYVAPGTKGQYTQEFILGAEYELMSDFKMGINYINRSLPRIIEDMSTDGASNYFIANPGEDYSAQAADLEKQAETLMATNAGLADIYMQRASWLRSVNKFDKPIRDYNAIQITATQRPTKKSLLVGSYTYSKSRGNYPGLFSTETGQLDPNLTSMYDLPDLMANRYGATGLDRPHLFKVDGFYTVGPVLIGASFRAQSGLPANTLAAHPLYRQGESFLLPRGELLRSPMNYNVDAKVQYGVNVGKGKRLEAFLDLFNLFNSQRQSDVDEIYSFQNSFPIVGGDVEDLAHAKRVNQPARNQPGILEKNKNYGKLSARQSPFAARLGVRFTF